MEAMGPCRLRSRQPPRHELYRHSRCDATIWQSFLVVSAHGNTSGQQDIGIWRYALLLSRFGRGSLPVMNCEINQRMPSPSETIQESGGYRSMLFRAIWLILAVSLLITVLFLTTRKTQL